MTSSTTPAGPDDRPVLAEIWCAALNRPDVRDDDNFFELGGHSLTGVIVLSAIEKRLGVALPLTDFYEAATFGELLEAVGRAPRTARPVTADPVRRERTPRASLMQERLLLDAARSTEPVQQILMRLAYRIDGPVDVARLTAAIQLVGERHEILRTSFQVVGDTVVQQIEPKPGIPVEVVTLDGRTGPDPVPDALRRVAPALTEPFDRSVGPMIRACIVRAGSVTVLVVVIDRLICDAGSLRLFLDDLSRAYAGLGHRADFRLPAAGGQFSDWSSWQRERLAGPAGAAMERYWSELLGPDPAVLGTPLPGYRPPGAGATGDVVEISLDAGRSDLLRGAARRHGVTLFAYLMAGLAGTVAELTGRPDLYLMTPVTNRAAAEHAETLGDLSHDVYLRVPADPGDDVAAAARRVQAAVATALENRLVPTTRVWECLWPDTYLQVFTEPIICFSLNEASATELELDGLTVHRIPDSGKGAIPGLDFWIEDGDGRLTFKLSFARGGYPDGTLPALVARMVDRLSR